MTGRLGALCTWGAVLALVVAAVVALRGRRPGLAVAAHRAGAALAAAAVACLGWALATGDFTLAYVAAVSDRAASWPYRLAGLWGGMAGSLLLWSALVAAWGWRRRPASAERAALAGLAAGLLAVGAVWASPWRRLAAPALDGEGLAPILDHAAMLVHPPLLYAGLTALAVPWAATVGALAVGDLGPAWAGRTRRQLLGAWAAVGAGMAIGAHWAYAEVGWGGFWAWDPVENTALVPWLVALGALHLLRAGRPGAGAAATCAALVLATVGTVLTRSGATPSVHAFAEDAAVGWALAAVAAAALAAPLAAWRGRRVSTPSPAPAPPPAGARRRLPTAAAAGLLGAAGVVLLGTVRPLVGEAAVAVEGTYYAGLVGPLAVVAAAALVGAGLVRRPWRRPSALAHVGFLVALVGVLGSTGGGSASATLAPGEAVEVAGWQVRNDGVAVTERGGHDAVEAAVALVRGGDVRAVLRPALVAHPERVAVLPETALRSTPLGDVLVALRDADDGGRALVEVHVRPLVWWVWWGAGLLAFAGTWAALARRSGATAPYGSTAATAAHSEASSPRSSAVSAP